MLLLVLWLVLAAVLLLAAAQIGTLLALTRFTLRLSALVRKGFMDMTQDYDALKGQLDTLAASEAATKATLDQLVTDIAAITTALPPPGTSLTADELIALKNQLGELVTAAQANTAEAQTIDQSVQPVAPSAPAATPDPTPTGDGSTAPAPTGPPPAGDGSTQPVQ